MLRELPDLFSKTTLDMIIAKYHSRLVFCVPDNPYREHRTPSCRSDHLRDTRTAH